MYDVLLVAEGLTQFEFNVGSQVVSGHRHMVMLGGLAASSRLPINAFHEFCRVLCQKLML